MDPNNLQSKNQLTRYLIMKRVRESPELNMDQSAINSLEGMMLAGMPESTIVAITELYAKLKDQGISDNQIFQRFESMRPGSGKMPTPLNLSSYIKYRLRLEHNHGANLSDKFIESAIEVCCKYYNCEVKNKTVAKNQKSTTQIEQTNYSKKDSSVNAKETKSKIGTTATGAVLQTVGIVLGFIAPFILAGMVAGATDSGTAAVITFIISLAAYFIWLKNKDK